MSDLNQASQSPFAQRAGRLLTWLRKPTPPKALVPQMEGLRFVALAAVFFLHFDQAVRSRFEAGPATAAGAMISMLSGLGDFGVQLFFAVSGFVLALPFARWHLEKGRPVELRQYFLRRLWRLEPPLLINLLLLLPVTVLVIGQLTWPEAVQRFFLTLFYSHYVTSGEMSPINRVTWSLETEAQFYLFMPLLGMLFRMPSATARRATLIVLSLLCMMCKPLLNKALLPAQFEYFAVGILLADCHLTSWSARLGSSRGWDIAGLLAWVALPFTLIELHHVQGLTKSGILASCVFVAFAAALRGKHSHRLAGGSLITLIGGMCYSFYLYHDPVLRFGSAALRTWMPAQYESRFIVELLILLPAVAVVTLLMYAAFERPFMGRTKTKVPGGESVETQPSD